MTIMATKSPSPEPKPTWLEVLIDLTCLSLIALVWTGCCLAVCRLVF